MKKNKFNTYNDGVIKFGEFKDVLNEVGNVERKEFVEKGKLFFSYSQIREMDKYKFNTELKSEIKLKVIKNNIINSNYVVEHEGKFYEIEHIDKGNKDLFLFIFDYIDKMNKKLKIYKLRKSPSVLQDDIYDLNKIVFSKIEMSLKEETKNDSIKSKVNIKATIKYLEELDPLLNSQCSQIYKFKFQNKFYNINSIRNEDENNKFLQIEGVEE